MLVRHPLTAKPRFGVLELTERFHDGFGRRHDGRPFGRTREHEVRAHRIAKNADPAGAQGREAVVDRDDRDFQLRLQFTAHRIDAHVGHDHFVTTHGLKGPRLAKRRDAAVRLHGLFVGGVLAQLLIGREHLDAHARTGRNAQKFRLHHRGRRRVDARRHADPQNFIRHEILSNVLRPP